MNGSKESERRDTALALELKDRIRRDGPISVADYMHACLHDREHGYYRKQAAVGALGDFVTAPEISQVFGELIGLWSAVVWQQMGAPAALDLVELGPGRGTMMADALRATRLVPGFGAAARMHLIESNERLQATQQHLLAAQARNCRWHASLNEFVAQTSNCRDATIVIGNEFLDTCPASQFQMAGGRAVPRGVGLDETGALAFVMLKPEEFILEGAAYPDGTLFERQDFDCVGDLVALMRSRASSAVLLIDYGHAETQAGETLQALRQHRAEHPLCSPGEADLTVHVDFAAFQRAVRAAAGADQDLVAAGPITQAEFLGRLGIMERASRLMAANADKALAIETGVARLMAPGGMGSRFKVLGLHPAALGPLPGFASE